MKKLRNILIGVIIFVSSSLCFGQSEYITLSLNNVDTNAVAIHTNTNTRFINGSLDNIVLDLSGAVNPTVDVVIATSPDYGIKYSRTLLNVTSVTADSSYSVRSPAVTTSGTAITSEASEIPLMLDRIYMTVFNANKTNINVKAIIYY